MPEFNPNSRTAPTLISGTRGHENLNAARVVVDMADDILLFQPEATPLLTITGRLRKKREAFNPLFEWLEKDEYPRTLDVTAPYDSNDTSISVTAGHDARVYVGCVVQNIRTGELILVNATPTSGSLGTVVRGIGGGQSDGIVGDKLLFVFNAIEDGADTPALRSVQEAAPRLDWRHLPNCRTRRKNFNKREASAFALELDRPAHRLSRAHDIFVVAESDSFDE